MMEEACLSLIQKLLTRNNETIVDLSDMTVNDSLYEDLRELCGDDIYDSLDGVLRYYIEEEDEDDTLVCFFLLDEDRITGLFMGHIETEGLESSYTCAKPGGSRGELLGYLGLLKARKDGAKVSVLYGSSSGGIPAIRGGDSHSTIIDKKKALLDYHEKRGATIYGEDTHKMFRYTIGQVLENVRKLESRLQVGRGIGCVPEKGRHKQAKKARKPKKRKTNKKRAQSKKKKALTKKLTPETYKELIHRRQAKKRMTKKQKKQLDNELFVNYCKCIKKLKYEHKDPKGREYPFCTSSVYKNRGFEFPEGTTKRCKGYKR
jgi:hypothetical protein